jgi:hypothetical protein
VHPVKRSLCRERHPHPAWDPTEIGPDHDVRKWLEAAHGIVQAKGGVKRKPGGIGRIVSVGPAKDLKKHNAYSFWTLEVSV